MEKWEGSQLNTAKEILAHELTELVHGKEEADKAEAGAKALFAGGADAEIPTTELTESDLLDGNIDILGLLVKSGLSASRSEARRSVRTGRRICGRRKDNGRKKAVCGRRPYRRRYYLKTR